MRRALVALAVLAGPAFAQADPARGIRAIIADPRGLAAPGCAVGVFRDGRTLAVAAGAADLATRRPIDADTLFYAASLSKQFTMLALAQLVERGKVRLGDDVRRWLPELSFAEGPITIDMLVHHIAGVPNINILVARAGYRSVADAPRATALKLMFGERHTRFAPGSRFEYSNGGYLLLSEIVARIAGEPFTRYVTRSVLRPMGMTRTVVMEGARVPVRALGYALVDGAFAPRDGYPLFGGAGGMMTSINELARYDHDIAVGHKVWTPAITRLMNTPGRYPDGAPIVRPVSGHFYASGQQIGPHWIYHGGSQAGFKNVYARLPDRGIGLAVLCNRGEIEPMKRADAIVATLGDELPPVSERAPRPGADPRYVSDPNAPRED